MRTEELLALGVFGRGSRLGTRIEHLLRRSHAVRASASSIRIAAGVAALVCALGASSLAPHWIAFAQQLRFEVASVRPSSPEEISAPESSRARRIQADTERFIVKVWPLKAVVAWAYGMKADQIQGGPAWTDSAFFDIDAKAAQPVTPAQMQEMVRTLLEERFHVALHRETRQMTADKLVVAKGGPKLTEVAVSTSPQALPGMARHGAYMFNTITGTRTQMWQVADVLRAFRGDRRPMIDATGLTGSYDFKLEWATDGPDSPGPSLETALEEQIGLKLETQGKFPVEFVVVDRAERPEAN